MTLAHRNIPFRYQKTVTHEGTEAFRYSPVEQTFHNPQVNFHESLYFWQVTLLSDCLYCLAFYLLTNVFVDYIIHTDSTVCIPLSPELNSQNRNHTLSYFEFHTWSNKLTTSLKPPVWAWQLLLLPRPAVPPLRGLWPWNWVSLSSGMLPAYPFLWVYHTHPYMNRPLT